MSIVGLVLTGGGARAAYQVGALKALAELLPAGPSPFPIMVGSSAGAINATSLAAEADDFRRSVRELEDTWRSLTPERIFRTDVPSLAGIGLRWMGALLGGGPAAREPINHLLDTEPLRQLLQEKLGLDRLARHFRSGALRGVAVSATNYLTGTAVTFYDGVESIEPWARSTRLGRRQPLTVEHVMASSAIPLFFPPVLLERGFFGDGCVRLTAPLSPAIHLGSDKLVAVSIRYLRSQAETATRNLAQPTGPLTLAEISGVLLNAVFLDAVEADVERLERINRTLSMIPEERRREVPHALRPIPALVLRPSQDLGELAAEQHRRFPAMLRYLLSGLGVGLDRGSDLLSYLAFEPEYVGRLIELGHRDTLSRADEIRAFLA